jgi:hypothetical protein
MSEPENPSLSLLCKLGSIVVHAEEMLSGSGHPFDRIAIVTLLEDTEVQQWIEAMGVYLPQKRGVKP